MDEILNALKKRQKIFKKLIKEEDLKIQKLKYKSRSIRLNNPYVPRKNWYVDRLQELELCISFFKGEITSKEFTHHRLDDSFGMICQLIGNEAVQNN